jgi:signal transduction histidine kinase
MSAADSLPPPAAATHHSVSYQQAEKMYAMARLAGCIAHDFNNIVGVILGHTELAMCDIDPAHPAYDSLREIEAGAHRAQGLTRKLLALAHREPAVAECLDLNAQIEQMLPSLRSTCGSDIDFLWMPGSGVPPVQAEPEAIDQILIHLCDNARDAVGGAGQVTLRTRYVSQIAVTEDTPPPARASRPHVQLAVSDNGCGMNNTIMQRMFEPFYTTKSAPKGIGLGLAMVYGLVQQHHGFVTARSAPGAGTTFEVYFPCE